MAGSKAIAVQKPWTAIFLHLTAIADGYTAEMPIVSGFVVPKINLSAFFINRFIDLTDMLLHLRSHLSMSVAFSLAIQISHSRV